ncbi:hypothetical protein SanaruYs_11200 [Chryseotalea sanaruensis]|uniref:Helix-turn-helix type 11 domain-containing protein n=1 Tax=Chryseotalea sanaruensis TaxID=2482724 RepID=A0A401U7N0_9BACT|nr:HTH domain-containing protein [Chryseotalea sanaruensis]GCC50901.1 hypothetical protein SanaruYs_11200 [Chryseotalea sanaruensis]
MSLLKAIDRLQRLDYSIRTKTTGTANEFANKLGISRSTLMENLAEMRALGAEICFCHHRKTYFYSNDFKLLIGDRSLDNIKGGDAELYNNYARKFYQSDATGHPYINLVQSI